MPARAKRAAAAPSSIYVLKVTLLHVEPVVWRRLKVPSQATLGWVHAALQVAMGWTNSHLHSFFADGVVYSPPGDFEDFGDGPKDRNENTAVLAKVLPAPGAWLGYMYDMGDSWRHKVILEQILPAPPAGKPGARCVDGAGACPPDDCGGAPGYMDLVKILKNPKHKEHASMRAWLGRPFDPAVFDMTRANVWLARLPWPRVTVEQLAVLLSRRDGV